MRPAEICQQLLRALEPSEGRRRQRKRDTTPDAVGLSVKRELLKRAIAEKPAAEEFEEWLLTQCRSASSGPFRAMALEILSEWRLAEASPAFRDWLERGAPSDDAEP